MLTWHLTDSERFNPLEGVMSQNIKDFLLNGWETFTHTNYTVNNSNQKSSKDKKNAPKVSQLVLVLDLSFMVQLGRAKTGENTIICAL